MTIHEGWFNGPDKDIIAWTNSLTYIPIFSEDIVSKFPQIRVPSELIIGTRDRTGPGRGWKKPGIKYSLGQYQNLGKTAVARFPKGVARLHELTGLGHMPQFEDYDRFGKVFYSIIP